MDIVIAWNPALAIGDWTLAGGGIASSASGSDDLTSAVLVSLFTDMVAPADYAYPPSDADPRGWWADSYEASPIGSRLWTLERAKKTDGATILRQARTCCSQALQWLLDDGVAASIDVRTSWLSGTALGIAIAITKPAGQTFNYAWTWQGF